MRKVLKFFLSQKIIDKLKKLRLKYQLLDSLQVNIVRSEHAGELVTVVKDETYETTYFPKVYDIMEEVTLNQKSKSLNLMKYSNAKVFEESDFILLGNKAVWHKSTYSQFTKIKPSDRDLLKHTSDRLFIKKIKRVKKVEIGFSLCGVSCKPWSHFMLQYLPKLYLVPSLMEIEKRKITIILPEYLDSQVREVVYSYLSSFDNLDILELNNDFVAECNILYHIDNTSWMSECVEYTSPLDSIIPSCVGKYLKDNFVNSISITKEQENEIIKRYSFDKKIFIARNNYRNLINYKEVEQYYKEKGYLVMEPHKYTLIEKIVIFRNAKLIVGPHSSGFSNLVFCQPNTKVLMMLNYQKIFEPWIGFCIRDFNIDITNLSGFDENSTDFNSSYTIPLDKIVSACEELGF